MIAEDAQILVGRVRWCAMSMEDTELRPDGGGTACDDDPCTCIRGTAAVPAPPADAAELETWLRDLVRSADPRHLPAVLAAAETAACTRFPPHQVLAALRRALATIT